MAKDPSLFRVRLKEHLVIFRYNGLPKGLHFTIPFNGKDLNLHLTKENGTLNDKPCITIARLKKEDAHEALEKLAQHIFSKLFVPLKDQKVSRAFRGGLFISIGKLDSTAKGTEWLKKWEEGFPQMLLSDKKGFKIPTSITNLFSELIKFDEDMFYNSMKKITKRFYIPPTTELGLILKDAEVTLVKCINKRWYQIAIPDRKKDFLAPFFAPGLRRHLIVNTYKALKNIQTALSSSDTAKYESDVLELSIIR